MDRNRLFLIMFCAMFGLTVLFLGRESRYSANNDESFHSRNVLQHLNTLRGEIRLLRQELTASSSSSAMSSGTTANGERGCDWSKHNVPIVIGTLTANPSYRVSLPMDNHLTSERAMIASGQPVHDIGGYAAEYQTFFKTLPQDSIYLDVGGNIGLTTMPVAAMGFRVITFEPVSYNVHHIVQSVVANGFGRLVRVVHAAVSNEAGNTTIWVPKGRGDNASLGKGPADHLGLELVEEHVTVVTLDGFLHTLGDEYDVNKIGFMKVDVQGFELRVLKGARNLLRDARSLIIRAEFETHTMRKTGDNPLEMLQLLDSQNFDIYLRDYDGPLLPPSEFASYAARDRTEGDIICRKRK